MAKGIYDRSTAKRPAHYGDRPPAKVRKRAKSDDGSADSHSGAPDSSGSGAPDNRGAPDNSSGSDSTDSSGSDAPDSAEASNKTTTMRLLQAGRCSSLEEHLYRPPIRGEKRLCALATWSQAPSATSREDFARHCAESVEKCMKNPEKNVCHVMVVKEPHSMPFDITKTSSAAALDIPFHFHAVLVLERVSRLWAKLAAELKKRCGANVDIRVTRGAKGGDVVAGMISYITVPSGKKWAVDKRPFLSQGFPLTQATVTKSQERKARLRDAPAKAPEIWLAIQHSTAVKSGETFRRLIDQAVAASQESSDYWGLHLPIQKIQNWFY